MSKASSAFPSEQASGSRRFRTAKEAEAYLLSFINYEIQSRYRMTTETHDLRRFEAVLRDLGWDPAAVPTIHVGGTNGKGSVAWLLERILRAGGLRTGLYSSPHLRSMRERIRVDGKPLGAEIFRDRVGLLARAFDDGRRDGGFRTTFEHWTALALLRFQEERVDRAVVEVGLGGRLDATNVIAPGPAVLTPVGLDHRHILGRTVEAITRDKVHILKRGGEAFVMPQGRTAAPVIRRWARARRIPTTWTQEAVSVDLEPRARWRSRLGIRGKVVALEVDTRLLGAHQAGNVAAAVAVAERVLEPARAREAVLRGLSGALVPGRLHPVLSGGRLVILDGGHNPGAARAVRQALDLHEPEARVVAVVGMARDKDHGGYLRALAPRVERFFFCRAGSPRAADPDRLAERCPRPARVLEGVAEAMEAALGSQADAVLVSGSFLVVAEAMEALGVSCP